MENSQVKFAALSCWDSLTKAHLPALAGPSPNWVLKINKQITMRIILIFFLSALFHPFSNACNCVGERSVKKEFKKSDIVFVGKIISKDTFSIKDIATSIVLPRVKYQVEIQSIYKGKVSKNILFIITGVGGGDCGYEFSVER